MAAEVLEVVAKANSLLAPLKLVLKAGQLVNPLQMGETNFQILALVTG